MDFPANFPFFSIIFSLLSAVICIFLKDKKARNFTLFSRFAAFSSPSERLSISFRKRAAEA